MICPQCRSADCSRSRRSGSLDHLCSLIELKPWRCQACDYRFRAWKVAVPFSIYAHCGRCGNFNVDRISADRVGRGALVALQRFLGLTAYRCDPCRQKFFTVRPYRRIVPSMLSVAERKTANLQ